MQETCFTLDAGVTISFVAAKGHNSIDIYIYIYTQYIMRVRSRREVFIYIYIYTLGVNHLIKNRGCTTTIL